MAVEKSNFSRKQAGFSLIETLVATSLLATALVALAELMAVGAQSNAIARRGTLTSILAEQKMEQLRSLTWGFDAGGLPVSDITTDTSVSPESKTGGKGLLPSPETALNENTDGYVDYLDEKGVQLGGGTVLPSGTIYIRRWSVEPLPTNPNNTLIIQVLVTRSQDRGTADAGSVARMPGEARLVSVKTRKTT